MKEVTASLSPMKWLVILILLLANLIVWGSKMVTEFPRGRLYSSGIAFATDGTVLRFLDSVQFKDEYFNYSIKVSWNDRSNTMLEYGLATRGLLGEYNVVLTSSKNFGASLLDEVDFDDEMSFSRGYMQSINAKIKLLPLAGEFEGACYYLMYMNKIYCGSVRRSPQ